MRAASLAGAAIFAIGCALAPMSASAQLLGTCPAFTPPPCIITDPGKIAGTVAEIKQKKRELEAAIRQVKEYTSLNGALGKIGIHPGQLRAALAPVSSPAFQPLTKASQKVAITQAANSLDAVLSSYAHTVEGEAQAEREYRLRLRAAGGEGYAIASATKYKLAVMNQQASTLTSQMQTLDSTGNGTDVRSNWAINQSARRLMFEALLALREVQAARLQLASLQTVPTQSKGESIQRSEAPPAVSVQSPGYAEAIGNLANATNKLASLKNAQQLIRSFLDGIEGVKQTQAEYAEMKRAADKAQRNIQSMANYDAARKGVSAAELIRIADQHMQAYDRTTWDNPNKRESADSAGRATEKALDRRVKGDVHNDWSKYLLTRAEAFKQEAFFRPIASDAAAMEKQTIEALADYEQSLGVDASNPAALNSAIAAAEAEVAGLRSALAKAPSDIKAIAEKIYGSSGAAQAGSPPPAPTYGDTPDWEREYASY